MTCLIRAVYDYNEPPKFQFSDVLDTDVGVVADDQRQSGGEAQVLRITPLRHPRRGIYPKRLTLTLIVEAGKPKSSMRRVRV